MTCARPQKSLLFSRESEIQLRVAETLQLYCAILNSFGFEKLSASPKSWEQFAQLPLIEKQKVYVRCLNALDELQSAQAEGICVKDTQRLFHQLIARNQWVCAPQLESHLAPDDVVEIYTADGVQLWRNMRFLEICSYPMLDLYQNPWPALYSRPQMITQKLLEQVDQALRDHRQGIFRFEVPDHVLEERSSPSQMQFMIRQGVFSPITNVLGQLVGFVTTLKADRLGSHLYSSLNVHPFTSHSN